MVPGSGLGKLRLCGTWKWAREAQAECTWKWARKLRLSGTWKWAREAQAEWCLEVG